MKSCPICGGEVKGNKNILYYCKHCNLLFREEQLSEKKKKQ